jgi:hypothetical protein
MRAIGLQLFIFNEVDAPGTKRIDKIGGCLGR